MITKTRYAAIVVLAVFISVPASAQQWATKMFQTTSHDFGVVARGQKAEYAFVFENLYVETIHIAGVHASCSCTTPEVKNSTLKTHDTGIILAKFNTSTFRGAHGATLTVTIDKPFFAEVQLQVRGYIRSDVELAPGSVDFGEIEQGHPYDQDIMVNHAAGDEWRHPGHPLRESAFIGNRQRDQPRQRECDVQSDFPFGLANAFGLFCRSSGSRHE